MNEKLLTMLYAQEWVSGQAASSELNVSRAAVAKHINALREQGYAIEAVPHRGYHLLSAPEQLTGFEITRRLKPGSPWQVACFDEIDSTNAYLRRNGDQLPEFSAVLAESQTAGRGRLERSWHSPQGVGLWMSVLLHPQLPPTQAQLLTLTAAVSIADAIDSFGLPCRIKWPNDILSPERRKLVGVLCEMRADMERVHWLVVGMGINVNNTDFPPELSSIATSLRELNQGQALERAAVAAAVLDALAANYELLNRGRFDLVRDKWHRRAVALNEEAAISGLNGKETGIVRGLDEEGYLLLEQNGTVKRVLAGDMIISH